MTFDPSTAVDRALAAGRDAMAESARAMVAARDRFDGVGDALDVLVRASGRVVVTGLGKSGLVGTKLASTLASTGTPAFFVHAGDALHGDAGMVAPDDVLLAISNSGETPEVCHFADLVHRRGVRVVAMTGCGGRSSLSRGADASIDVSVAKEADPYDLVPTTSTEVTAAVGDAIAVALMVARGFGPDDFHAHHPAGSLGQRLAAASAPVRPAPTLDADVHVCVFGSFMMDLTVRAPRRPRAGETVIGTDFGTYLGGKGFNQAVAAARQGASTAMIGRLGDDEYGRAFVDSMATEGIASGLVALDPHEGTGVGLPLVEDSGENSIAVVPRANHRITVDDVGDVAEVVGRARVLLLQLELPIEVVVAAACAATKAGVLVVLNPAPAVADLAAFVGFVDVIVPNETEASLLTGLDPATPPEQVARELASTTGAGVVLTLGESGSLVLSDGETTRLPAHPVDVVDSTGAGDAFCGALGARLAVGDSLVDAATYANAAAALCVTGRGAGPSMPTTASVSAILSATRTESGRLGTDFSSLPG